MKNSVHCKKDGQGWFLILKKIFHLLIFFFFGLNVFVLNLFWGSLSLQQKIVLKLPLDDERKKRKAFKAAVGMNGKIN